MNTYHVMWEVYLDAESPSEAALLARHFQTDPETTATVFCVTNQHDIRTIVDVEGGTPQIIRDENG